MLLLHATSGDAGETARRILAAADIARAANCVGLRRRIEDLVADMGGRRGRAPSGGLWPVLEHARSAVLIVTRAFGQLAIDTALVDTVTLRADSEIAVAQGLMIRACIYPSLVGGSRYSTSPVSAGSASADTTARRPRLADTRPSLFNCSRARWAVPADTL